jgi:hypothetical protein
LEEAPATDLWLVARWYQAEGNAVAVADPRTALRRIAADSLSNERLLASSLLHDLVAHDLLATGDTAGAMDHWTEAVSVYDVAEVPFGLLGSLWPVHVDRVQIAAQLGNAETVFASAEVFKRMAGFLDQLAWESVLLTEGQTALGTDRTRALGAYQDLLRVMRTAQGERAQVRDSLERLVARLR